MEITEPFVFQADSEIVNEHYKNNPNYLIDYNNESAKEYCIIYFSSNNLYYPNSEIAFTESIIKKNRFEWFGNRINFGHKHIFLRDLKKQWYLTGINADINTPDKLISFLREESKGYKIIVLGSSAGGYNAVSIGQSIGAERIYSFNGQFEILSLLEKSKANVDPVIFRNKENKSLLPYYNTLNFIKDPSTIFYFHSNNSLWDIEQYEYAKHIKLHKISFKTSNHGIPFLKTNLPSVLNLPIDKLLKLSGNTYHPLFFSLKLVGLIGTVKGLNTILQFGLNIMYIKTIQKWKHK